MKINNYYQKTAKYSLWIGGFLCTAGIILFAVNLFNIVKEDLNGTLISIFMMSATLITVGIINRNRSIEVIVEESEHQSEYHKENEFIMMKMTSSLFHIAFYTPSGYMTHEMKGFKMNWIHWLIPKSIQTFMKKEWIIADHSGYKLGYVSQSYGLYPPVKIYDGERNLIGEIRESKSLVGIKGSILDQEGNSLSDFDLGSLLYDYKLHSLDHTFWCHYREGWLQLEWGKRFKDVNQDTLVISPNLPDNKKLIVHAFAGYMLYRKSS